VPGVEVDALAVRAGEEMAGEAVRVWGRREYWRAGFARGVSSALADTRVGAWDREQGLRSGRADSRARALGDHLANEAAEGRAERDAETRIRAQFMDLAHEPVRDRTGAVRAPDPPNGFEGPFAAEPLLDDVFVAYPLNRFLGLSGDGRRAIEGWPVEPKLLARDRGAGSVYDAKWSDPESAFSTWKNRQGPGSYWFRLKGEERDRFHDLFCDRFSPVVASADTRITLDAWRAGFEEGWRYGAIIAAEWAYRRGYAEGFDAGVRETAVIAFPYAYGRAYDAAQERWFDEWSHTAHAGIGEIRLADESGDGIFEPGERVLIDVDVVNYGGGSGVFDLIASGREFGRPETTALHLSGRGPVSGVSRLTLRADDRVPARTRTGVTVALADARADAPVYISRPLEIDGAPTIDADRLQGRVTIRFVVDNASRREARAIVRVESLGGAASAQDHDLGPIAAGSRQSASLTFDGIHPLDLIGAESRWRASVAHDGTMNDTREIRLAPVATDLGNPDLMDFTVALAGTKDVSRSDVQDARALMMERLRADWSRAADASGNPYKRDYETEGVETVLGQLVRLTQKGSRSFASPQVFDGLGHAIAVLADDLPGAHPLLRKWMKKLAARMT
jgi:hypothetical protein